MSEPREPIETVQGEVRPMSHRRILVIMAALVLAGTVPCFVYGGWRVGVGFLIGGALSFVNYYWMKASLGRFFELAAGGEKPKLLATSYVLRYVVLGAVLLVIYLSKIVSAGAFILGLTTLAFAIVIEAFIRLFASIFNKKDI